MDPTSIVGLVAACSSLAKQSASVIKTLHELADTYKSAELSIISMVTECETIQFAWRKIGVWANENLHCIADFEDLGERLQKSIYCGELVMSALEEDLGPITANLNGFRRRLGVLWNNGVFNEHQSRVRGQVAALQLLLQVLSLPHKEDRAEVLSVKEKIFSDADESALSIIPSDRSTRFSIDGNRMSIISDDNDIQYIRFDFEDALFTSHVYKRNYRFPMKKTGNPIVSSPEADGAALGQFDFNFNESNDTNKAVDLGNGAQDEYFEEQMAQFCNELFPEERQGSTYEILRPGSTTLPTPHLGKEQERIATPMLRSALKEADTAVLLDQALNFVGARKHYKAASDALLKVIVSITVESDQRKLHEIRRTYINRVAELDALIPGPQPERQEVPT